MAHTNAVELARKLIKGNPEAQAEYDRLGPRFAIIRDLIKARKRVQLTQAELGARMGVSQAVIARLESAEQSPRIDTLVNAAHAMGMRMDVNFVRDASVGTPRK